MDRQQLRRELIRDEGCKQHAYQDSVGLWTIGVGHLLGIEKRMTWLMPSEIDALLNSDINDAFERAINLVGQQLIADHPEDDVRLRALTNMSFNLGGGLAGFHDFLSAYKARDWQRAAAEMMDSKWAKQVGDRAERLRVMILEG